MVYIMSFLIHNIVTHAYNSISSIEVVLTLFVFTIRSLVGVTVMLSVVFT